MIVEESLPNRQPPDLLAAVEQDLTVIRRDLVLLMQETANVRASMTEFSSWRPAASRRYVVVSGLVCFIIMSVLVIYQGEVRDRMQRISAHVFMPHS